MEVNELFPENIFKKQKKSVLFFPKHSNKEMCDYESEYLFKYLLMFYKANKYLLRFEKTLTHMPKEIYHN